MRKKNFFLENQGEIDPCPDIGRAEYQIEQNDIHLQQTITSDADSFVSHPAHNQLTNPSISTTRHQNEPADRPYTKTDMARMHWWPPGY